MEEWSFLCSQRVNLGAHGGFTGEQLGSGAQGVVMQSRWERQARNGPHGPQCYLLCPWLPVGYLLRLPALKAVGVGRGLEDGELHPNTLELADPSEAQGEGYTSLRSAALFPLSLPFSFQHPPDGTGIQGVGCGCVLCRWAAQEWFA